MRNIIWILSVLLVGCTTSLWAPAYKTEHVIGFYVNERDHSLLVSTATNGYVLSITERAATALTLSRIILFRPEFKQFSVDKHYNVTGQLALVVVDENITVETREQLHQLGFTRDESRKRLVMNISLSGKRYLIEGELPMTKLDKEHSVSVQQPHSFSATAGKIVATPFTISYDAVIVVPAVFVGAFVMALESSLR